MYSINRLMLTGYVIGFLFGLVAGAVALLATAGLFSCPADAAEVRVAAGGLLRDNHEVVQLSVVAGPVEAAYTHWHTAQSASLLYHWDGKFFDAAAGATRVSEDDPTAEDRTVAHARVGVHAGNVFVSYDRLQAHGYSADFIMGGLRFGF